MSGAKPWKVWGTLLLVWGVLALITGLQGGFYFGKHESDTLHLIQIVTRMANGDLPHLDFMTPIGIGALAPISVLMQAGLDLGPAILWAQLLIAALLLVPLGRAGTSRLSLPVALALGLVCLLMATGVVHGGTDTKLSISMHYNRWAWAISFVVLVLAILPARSEHPVLDGALIGLGMAALLLIKVTYFVALVPAVLLALITLAPRRALWAALISGLTVALLLTLFLGLGFWFAYMADLQAVAGSSVRAAPGATLAQILLAPSHFFGTLLGIAGVMLLRRGRDDRRATVMALLFVGALYITYQNFGNDPLWLLIWALLLWQLRPTDAAVARWALPITLVAGMSLALIAPVALNILSSPLRMPTQPKAVFTTLLPAPETRVYAVAARMRSGEIRLPYLAQTANENPQKFMQSDLPDCTLSGGLIGWLETISDQLRQAGLGQQHSLFVADLFNGHWLYGGFKALHGGAPWYYGGLPGIDAADYLLVPLCPVDQGARQQILSAVSERGLQLELKQETQLYRLYDIQR